MMLLHREHYIAHVGVSSQLPLVSSVQVGAHQLALA